MEISVLTPVYKAESCIEELYRRLVLSLNQITSSYEIIFVEDCGGDNSWKLIREIAKNDKKVLGIKFSRNFGQHRAITAGLAYASGKYVVVMDCDLQDAPEEIDSFYTKIKEGYDIVVGRRHERKDGFFKRLFSNIFYRFYGYATGTKIDSSVANFGMYSKRVVENYLKLKEQHRFFPITVRWLGFNYTSINISHSDRFAGKSSYTFLKLLRHAADNIISNSSFPLLVLCNIGIVLSIISFIFGSYFIFRWCFWGGTHHGWTSLMVTINFLGGIIISSIGIIGLYIRKIFEEVKERPLYIIDEFLNLNDER